MFPSFQRRHARSVPTPLVPAAAWLLCCIGSALLSAEELILHRVPEVVEVITVPPPPQAGGVQDARQKPVVRVIIEAKGRRRLGGELMLMEMQSPRGRDAWLTTILRTRDIESARAEAERELDRRLAAIAREVSLTEPQRQKLELAGRGDIGRFLNGCLQLVQGAEAVEASREEAHRLLQECMVLRGRFRRDLHGERSLLQKSIRPMLTAEQWNRIRPLLAAVNMPEQAEPPVLKGVW